MHTASRKRMYPQMLRLEGTRYENGETSIQNSPEPLVFAKPILDQTSNTQINNKVEGGSKKKENAA